jgi:uncharacterized glyoxalase superfamily protein PhnB
MITRISHVYLVVNNIEEAIAWYSDKLGFVVRMDVPFGEGQRWVTIGLPEQPNLEIALMQASEEQPDERWRKAGHVNGWCLESTDCRGDIEKLREKGVQIVIEPEEQMWGTQAGFVDLDGNMFIVVQPPKSE